MCAIFGILHFDPSRPVDPEDLTQSVNTMIHRGPDEGGSYIEKNVGFAHRRLSIIDLETGKQPLFNEDRSVMAVCNGEIYNHEILRQRLLKKGHRFCTRSDSEVIVHLYEEAGEEFVLQLRGMFALALWDGKNQKLILARDRLGIKPLFYTLDDQRLIFSSEINAIARHASFPREINYEALHDYLSFMTACGNKTFFKGMERLLPAELLIYTSQGIEHKIYWDPMENHRLKPYTTQDFQDILSEVVKLHLVSDVPVGAFLSGGLDSSAIVAFMSRILGKKIQTFSIGFSGSDYYNELPYARQVAQYYGTEHHEYLVSPDVAGSIPKIIEHFGEPFGVSSALPTFFLSKLASEKVKVVLTGDGADELLAGYTYRYLAIRLGAFFDRFPFLKKTVRSKVAQYLSGKRRRKFNKFISGLDDEPASRYFRFMSKFQEEEKKRLYSPLTRSLTTDFDSQQELLRYFHPNGDLDLLNKWLYVDIKTSLPNEMMVKVDSMSMAAGLEARVPFLDHELVEYACALPSQVKLRHVTPKYLLRKAVAPFLPASIVRREKHGFEVPLDEWIRGELKDYVRSYLHRKRIEREGFFDGQQVESLLNDHWGNRANHGHQIWMLLMFAAWHEKYFLHGSSF